MNILIKSLDLFAVMILMAATVGCSIEGGDQGSTGATQVLTEHDFGTDPSLCADPERHLIVKFLEHPDSGGHENDTGGIGHDIIPHTYTRTVEHTFCWEDDDPDAEHFMVIEDSEGNEILILDVGDCVTGVIVEGDYVMIIYHDGRIEKTHTVFIRHAHDEDLGVKKEETIPEGILERAGRVLSNILEKLDISIAQTTNAQTVEDNINTLISTGSCVGCELSGANLTGADLSGADLSGAKLTCTVDSSGAPICANLTSVGLTGVTLSSTIFTGATWCDGTCMCGDNSIDTCIGCASIDICIPPPQLSIPRRVKGMAYDPKPSNFDQVPSDGEYFDDDFYNEDFCQLWGVKTAFGCSAKPDKFRDDVGKMAKIGVNFIRMYDWNSERDTETFSPSGHQGFLEYAADMGMKVSIPFCNTCMGTATAEKIIEEINKYSNKAKSAIGLFIVGNELGGFLNFIPETLNAIKGATGSLSNVPICTPIKTNGSGKEAVVANALIDTTNVFNVYKGNSMEHRFIACVNFYGIGVSGSPPGLPGFPPEKPSQQLEEFVDGMLAPGTLLTNNSIPLLLSELGVFLVGGPAMTNGMCSAANIEPNAGGDESLQAMWLGDALAKSNDLIGAQPMYLGSVMFQFMNKNFSSVCPIDHNLGIFSLEQPSIPWQGEARNNNGNPPTDPPYPIDKLNETPRFAPVMNNY